MLFNLSLSTSKYHNEIWKIHYTNQKGNVKIHYIICNRFDGKVHPQKKKKCRLYNLRMDGVRRILCE